MTLRSLLLLLCLTVSGRAADAGRDEEILRASGVATEGPDLLKYFQMRTPDEADRKAIEEAVRNLGSRSFTVRERAFDQLKKRGVPAVPSLKKVLESGDLDLVRRAERCLAEIEQGASPAVSLAASRQLARKSPPGSIAALVAFVPHVEDDTVEEAVLAALVSLSEGRGKAVDPSLITALKDDYPLRRGAAAYTLGRSPNDSVRAEVRRLLADRVPVVRFRAAQGLLMGRDRSGVTGLMALLSDAPLSLAWQTEELLIRVAGEKAPLASVGAGDEADRKKSRDAWEQWWKKNADRIDLSQVEEVHRLLGLTLVVEYDTNLVWECGPEGLVRWSLKNLSGPMEAFVLPGNRVLLADAQGVTERDFTGQVLKRFDGTGSATGCQRLPNGNTFVSTYERVMEFDTKGTRLYLHDIGGSNAIRRRRNGNIIYTTKAHLIEMDAVGKRIRSIPIPREDMWVGLEEVEGDRFLLANSTTGRVIEVDAAGKILWETTVAGACGVARLPTGTTLISTNGRVVEVNRAGKTVWEKKTSGYARRVHRR